MNRQLALILLVTLAGCAPDAWKTDPSYNRFLNRIGNECFPLRIGSTGIDILVNNGDAFFLDQTSRLYSRRITPRQYEDAINGFFPGGDNAKGLQCILSKLPG